MSGILDGQRKDARGGDVPALRDWIAMHAPYSPLPATLAGNDEDVQRVIDTRAKFCYRWADAMLKARNK